MAIVVGTVLLFPSSGLVGQSAPGTIRSHAPRLYLTHSVNMPGGGWDWAEAVRTTRVGVDLPIVGAASIWFSVAKAEINNLATCASQCYYVGTPYHLQTGVGYRFAPDQRRRLVPFAGVGASLEQWSERGRRWMPHVQAGVEWNTFPHVALRLEVESEWSVPGRIASGVTLLLP